MLTRDPNFPPDLHIHPSSGSAEISGEFDEDAQQAAIDKYGIAGRVWEAAYVLSSYLDSGLNCEPSSFLRSGQNRPLIILELGSGTGVIASRIAQLLQTNPKTGENIVIATDLPEVCSLLEQNLSPTHRTDLGTTICVEPLAWGNHDHATVISCRLGLSLYPQSTKARHLTHIVCSDLVYFTELFAPLLRTLIQLTSKPFCERVSGIDIIMSYKIRSLPKETPFFQAFGLWFTFETVLDEEGNRLGVEVDAFIFIARRRPESVNWVVPEGDLALLNGMGAQETRNAKSDDTFETLLLMSLADAS